MRVFRRLPRIEADDAISGRLAVSAGVFGRNTRDVSELAGFQVTIPADNGSFGTFTAAEHHAFTIRRHVGRADVLRSGPGQHIGYFSGVQVCNYRIDRAVAFPKAYHKALGRCRIKPVAVDVKSVVVGNVRIQVGYCDTLAVFTPLELYVPHCAVEFIVLRERATLQLYELAAADRVRGIVRAALHRLLVKTPHDGAIVYVRVCA